MIVFVIRDPHVSIPWLRRRNKGVLWGFGARLIGPSTDLTLTTMDPQRSPPPASQAKQPKGILKNAGRQDSDPNIAANRLVQFPTTYNPLLRQSHLI
jgi:hypothetical protein